MCENSLCVYQKMYVCILGQMTLTGRLLLSAVPVPIMEEVETEDLTLFGQMTPPLAEMSKSCYCVPG